MNINEMSMEMKRTKIREGLPLLIPRNRSIMSFRWGLDDNQNKTLRETGNYFKLTLERIRIIERRCLIKMGLIIF